MSSRAENEAMSRCDQGGENTVTRLASVKCPNSLAFDIERQTCDWRPHVKNCDQLESKFCPLQGAVVQRANIRLTLSRRFVIARHSTASCTTASTFKHLLNFLLLLSAQVH